MNSNGTNKSYQACSIILLKIDFEGIINLGGENTHLGSKLEDPILGFGGWILMFKNPKSVPPFAATLKTEANQPKLVSSSPWVPSCRRNHAQPPSGVVVVVVVVVVWGWGSQNPNPWTAASHLISPSLSSPGRRTDDQQCRRHLHVHRRGTLPLNPAVIL